MNKVRPFYVILETDINSLKIKILDLNTIKKRERVDNKWKTVLNEDENSWDIKWIEVPGVTKTEQTRIIKYIKEMVFPDGERHPDKIMAFDPRRPFGSNIYEIYKSDIFKSWEKLYYGAEEE